MNAAPYLSDTSALSPPVISTVSSVVTSLPLMITLPESVLSLETASSTLNFASCS